MFALDPIGKMGGEYCKQLWELESPNLKVKAQYSETLHLVSGFKFFFEDADGDEDKVLLAWKKMPDATEEDRNTWTFNESTPLIGLYGYQSERGIEKLGFITLDTVSEQC